MQKKIIKAFLLLVIVFIISVLFIGLSKDSIYDTKNLTGSKLQNIKLNDFNEDKVISENYFRKNNFTLINFWASWCSPCRDEHPFLIELKKEKSLKLLGVNFKDNKKNAKKFLKNLGNPYDKIAKDNFGKQSINFGVYGVPESILINRELIIIKKFIGPISSEEYELIKKIVNNK
tara:strand:- start:901 stop:1425 length:525 start_codon:yes stop_codon:yes gene_type:complete